MTKIAFIHPDLGIGGAERLVVDAAVGLQESGNAVKIFTSHCDLTHCFDEVSSGVLQVSVFGDFLPTTIAGKFHILCAIARQFYLTLRLIFTGQISQFDYFIVDQLSFCVPLLSLFGKPSSKVLFYCHFPDQLLSKQGGIVKKLYRVPFDAIEEWSTGVSDTIVVNSTFTKSIFHKTFTHLSQIDPGVIYPCVDINSVETDNTQAENELLSFLQGQKFFLSINRFERLKNIDLAIRSFADLLAKKPQSLSNPKLLVAGGFDPRIRENVEYLRELEGVCDSLNIVHYTFRGKLVQMPASTQVIFLPSVKTSIKNAALKHAELLLYTPTFEHFGIVPVESMLNKTPVLAINQGGPLESIVNYDGTNIDKATGFNRPNNVEEWSSLLLEYLLDVEPDTKQKLGENGYERVKAIFSRDHLSRAFQEQLNRSLTLQRNKGGLFECLKLWRVWGCIIMVVALAYLFK